MSLVDRITADLASKGKNFVKGGISKASEVLGPLNQKWNPYAGSGGSAGNTRGNWKYPLTIQDSQHTSRLAFTATTAITGDEPDAGRAKIFGDWKRLRTKDIGTVFLYMPKIEQQYTQNYSDDGRGLAWQLVNAFQSAGGIDNFGDASAAALKTGIAEVANRAAPGLVRDFSQTVKNQHLSAHFTGTQLRRQKFTFEMRPRNYDELVQIAGILQFFKANSATSLRSGDTMETPARWAIEEICPTAGDRVIEPFRFGPAFLADVHIDKSPDGAWKTFASGDPIAFVLTLEFMEITIVTRDDIETIGL
ncbi:baseplate tail-tube junction protein [Pseudomonas phage Astolliot]|nr:baseplate tail-tube junction protein [Pseudomonas phage Astolliot]